jgi:hypothetical protein
MHRAAALAAALALGVAGCGGDDESDSSSTPTTQPAPKSAAVTVSPEKVTEQIDGSKPTKPAAKPNVLGGDIEITKLLDRLDADLSSYYADQLEPVGAKLSAPTVQRTAPAQCEGKALPASSPPQWCSREKVLFAPPNGADRLRNSDGPVALFLYEAWAHARAVGAQLGWQDAVANKQLDPGAVGQAEFCLVAAWAGYKNLEGVFENSDIDAVFKQYNDAPIFADIPIERRQQGFNLSNEGTTACVS